MINEYFLKEEEEVSVEGDPKALVDTMMKYAPNQNEYIKSMLKYAANSNPSFDIWDSAFAYFEQIEDNVDVDAEQELPTEELPTEEPTEEPEITSDEELPSDEDEFDLDM